RYGAAVMDTKRLYSGMHQSAAPLEDAILCELTHHPVGSCPGHSRAGAGSRSQKFIHYALNQWLLDMFGDIKLQDLRLFSILDQPKLSSSKGRKSNLSFTAFDHRFVNLSGLRRSETPVACAEYATFKYKTTRHDI